MCGQIRVASHSIMLRMGAWQQVQDTIPICPPQLSQHLALAAATRAGRPWVQQQLASILPNRWALARSAVCTSRRGAIPVNAGCHAVVCMVSRTWQCMGLRLTDGLEHLIMSGIPEHLRSARLASLLTFAPLLCCQRYALSISIGVKSLALSVSCLRSWQYLCQCICWLSTHRICLHAQGLAD